MVNISDIYNNGYIIFKKKLEHINVKVVSVLNDKNGVDEFVNSFLMWKTFPYVNSEYGELIDNNFNKLSKKLKKELISIIDKYLFDIEGHLKDLFEKASKEELIDNFGFSNEEVDKKSRPELYKSVGGGYFCEMLLCNILISLGYEKIISKLYLNIGTLSPTGIDVVSFNKHEKTIVLGECKIYKNIKMALDSCFKDMYDILLSDKFDREVMEWNAKLSMLNNNFSDLIVNEDMSNKKDVINFFDKIICVGFVLGNKIDENDLIKKLDSIPSIICDDKFEVVLICVPTNDKDTLVESCHKRLAEMRREYE
ncbi:MAG: DUF1837 domain-containing protein [Bacilli bacterium]|nr:DUF1837 domain-containing protein [Bacilli bacterium]